MTSPRPRLGSGRATPLSHRLIEHLIATLAFVSLAAITLIFVFIVKEALPLFWDFEGQAEIGGLSALVSPRAWAGYAEAAFIWQPVGDAPKLNIVPLIAGTLKVTVLAMLVATPIGVGAAVFVAEYAPRRLRAWLKPALELPASIPSVVLGFFALMFLASWLQAAFGLRFRLNALTAACGLALALVPIIFTISEDALSAVPGSLKDAAIALGARRVDVTLRVVLPAALPGIAASIVLAFGRAIGETMIVLLASGNAAVMDLFDPSTSARTITATLAAELGEVAQGDPHWRVLFLLGALLFIVTFILNRLGAIVIERLHHRLSATSA